MQGPPSIPARRRRIRLAWVVTGGSLAIALGAIAVWAFEPESGCGGGSVEFARIDRMGSAAMAPLLAPGDLVWVHRRAFCRAEPKRGDLAVVAPPRPEPGPLILRVVGLPGDQVELRRGQLFLNGVAVERDWLESAIHTDESGSARQATRFIEGLPGGARYEVRLANLAAADETIPALTVPPDHYFLLGDNRDVAEDSRAFGALARSEIVDRPWRILWSTSWDRVWLPLQ